MKRIILSPFNRIARGSLLFCLACALLGCAHTARQGTDFPSIYDSKANGEAQLDEGLTQARNSGKRVLLDLGANWCSDSQATARLFKDDPLIQREIRRDFVLVMVDVNQREVPPRNRKLLERLGDPAARGIPILLILSPDGRLLNTDPSERLRDDAHQRPKEVLAYLQKWASRKN